MTREQLDRLLEQTLLLDDHDALARRLDSLALTYDSGEVSRAAILALAAEEWRQAGQPATALNNPGSFGQITTAGPPRIMQFAADQHVLGGEVAVDPRAGIVDTLFELERPDEARQMINVIRGSDVIDPLTSLSVAETLAAYGDLAGAHQWATEGVRAGSLEEDTRDALLRTRYRIRVDLGLPEDDLDALLDLTR